MFAKQIIHTPKIDESDIPNMAKNAPLSVNRQEWAVIVVLGQPGHGCSKANTCLNIEKGLLAVNILGCFDRVEDAQDFITSLNAEGWNMYDIHIVKTNEFVVYPPPRCSATKQFQEKELQEIFVDAARHVNSSSTSVEERVMKDRKAEEEAREKRKEAYNRQCNQRDNENEIPSQINMC